jgi:hypothetical protein
MRAVGLLILVASGLLAADSEELSQAQIDDIVQKFAAKETEFAKARESYTYRQTARILDLDPGGNTVGRWETVSDIVFDSGGKRSEKVVRAPVSTLTNFFLGPEDLDDLKNVQPFVLTTNELPKYLVRYLGKETLDEISCYAFAVKPKKLDAGQRYFEGIVWVDDRDLQIVKSYGRGVGLQKRGADQQFPKFETYREQVDGKNWFPTYTIANSTLHFKDQDARMRETVKYEDYKQFKSEVKITFGDEADGKADGKKDDKKEPSKPAEPPKRP